MPQECRPFGVSCTIFSAALSKIESIVCFTKQLTSGHMTKAVTGFFIGFA